MFIARQQWLRPSVEEDTNTEPTETGRRRYHASGSWLRAGQCAMDQGGILCSHMRGVPAFFA